MISIQLSQIPAVADGMTQFFRPIFFNDTVIVIENLPDVVNQHIQPSNAGVIGGDSPNNFFIRVVALDISGG